MMKKVSSSNVFSYVVSATLFFTTVVIYLLTQASLGDTIIVFLAGATILSLAPVISKYAHDKGVEKGVSIRVQEKELPALLSV